MTEVYLLLGSNEGKPEQNLKTALGFVAERCGAVIRHSSLYSTEAWGVKEQHNFLNQAVSISTAMSSQALLKTLKEIETETGRIATTKWGPRVIDIDILFYGSDVVDLPELKIPHPYIQDRRFTLVPMNEVAPDLVHPVLGKTMAELLRDCKDESEVLKKQ